MGRAGVVVSGGWRLAGVLGLVGGSWLLFPGFGGGIYLAGGKVTLAGSPVADNKPDNCDPPGSVTGCVG
jgi:hypothetical protein